MRFACSGGNDRRILVGLRDGLMSTFPFWKLELRSYLGLVRRVSLIITNCAQMHNTFRCGPYANKKSQI